MKKVLYVLFASIAFVLIGYSQTEPSYLTLPVSQDFGTTSFNSLPNGFVAWNGVNGTTVTSLNLAEISVPTGDATVTAATTTQTGGNVYGFASSGNGLVYIQQSGNAINGLNQLAFGLNTGSSTILGFSCDLSIINLNNATRILGVVVQYRKGNSGAWTTINESVTTFIGASQNITPRAINATITGLDQNSNYQFRFASWRGTGAGNTAGYGIDNISIVGLGGAPSSDKKITTFTINGVNYSSQISGLTINVTVPSNVNLATATATGIISPNATANPAFPIVGLSGPVFISVTAEDLSTNVYTVTAVNATTLSDAKEILTFTIQSQVGPTTISGTNIAVAVPFATDITNLTATGTISAAATVNPPFFVGKNYTGGFVYTVTAEDLSTKLFTVNVTILPSVAGVSRYIENFDVNPTILGWSIYTPKSLRDWQYRAVGDMEANGFGSTGASPMESWLITPKLNFLNEPQAIGYGGSLSFTDASTPKPIQVLYSTNYIGSGPVSVAGWSVIVDDLALASVTGVFRNFTATGAGYMAFRYIASGTASGQSVRWRVDNVTINGVSIATPTVVGTVFNVEANLLPPPPTFTGIVPIVSIIGLNPTTFANTFTGTVTIAGQLIGRNIANNVGLSGGAQFTIFDATGATTVRIPSALFTSITGGLLEGHTITLAGTMGQNAGLGQFTASQIIAFNNTEINPRPAPLDVTVLNESTEARLVRVVAQVDSAAWASGKAAGSANGFNVNSTINGVTYVLRIYTVINDLSQGTFTSIFGNDEAIKTMTIIGLGGQFDNSSPFNSGYQLIPYQLSDFTFFRRSGVNTVTSFNFLPQTGLTTTVVGVINNTTNEITLTVPRGTTVVGLVPTIVTHPNATISPAFNVAPTYVEVDNEFFTEYTITAQNGAVRTYTVKVVFEKNNQAQILSFTLLPNAANGLNTSITGTISGQNILLTVPFGVSVPGLSANIVYSQGASSSSALNFVAIGNEFVVTAFEVVAENGVDRDIYQIVVSFGDVPNAVAAFSKKTINVYPNPSEGTFNVAAQAGSTIILYNVTGNAVKTVTAVSDVTSLNIATPGFYFVKVNFADGSTAVKELIIK